MGVPHRYGPEHPLVADQLGQLGALVRAVQAGRHQDLEPDGAVNSRTPCPTSLLQLLSTPGGGAGGGRGRQYSSAHRCCGAP